MTGLGGIPGGGIPGRSKFQGRGAQVDSVWLMIHFEKQESCPLWQPEHSETSEQRGTSGAEGDQETGSAGQKDSTLFILRGEGFEQSTDLIGLIICTRII